VKPIHSLFVAALLVAAPFASAASINLTFEEFAYGSSVGDCFNGGTDSLNRFCGNNYGISFRNDKVKYTPSGAYLSGGVQMGIDVDAVRSVLGSEKFYITFTASHYGLDATPLWVTFEDGFSEPQTYIAGTSNPYCTRFAENCTPYYGSSGTYRVVSYNGEALPTNIQFITDRLDNIQFHSYTGSLPPFQSTFRFGSAALDADIPEPSSIALLALGTVLLVRRRRQK
jgi:hypothetical protein